MLEDLKNYAAKTGTFPHNQQMNQTKNTTVVSRVCFSKCKVTNEGCRTMAYGAFLFFLSCFQSAVLLGTKESFGCPIKETPTDGIRPLLLLLFNAINQSYFMPFFYLLSGYFVKGLSSNAYTVYIVHQFVITALIVFFLRSAWPSALKFCIVALIGVPLCFFVSHFIVRKIPYSTRVLG